MDFLNIVVIVCLLGCVHSYNKEILDLYLNKVDGQAIYSGKSQAGSCQLGPQLPENDESLNIRYFVGVSKLVYAEARNCGMCIRVRATGGGRGRVLPAEEFLVVVNNVCSDCEEGRIHLAGHGNGRWAVEMQAVQCPVGNNMIGYKMHGSTPWYLRLQIRNARIPVQDVYVVRNGEEEQMSLALDGFWTLGRGLFNIPVNIKMVGVNDETIYDIIPHIENGIILRGEKGAQFSFDSDLPE